jgi:DNA-binding transcriptional regulator YiaG
VSHSRRVTITSRSVQHLAEARALLASGEARRIREAARLSLTDVAGAVGADYSSVGRWERGERVPRGPAAIKYARLLTRLRTQVEASCPPAA